MGQEFTFSVTSPSEASSVLNEGNGMQLSTCDVSDASGKGKEDLTPIELSDHAERKRVGYGDQPERVCASEPR